MLFAGTRGSKSLYCSFTWLDRNGLPSSCRVKTPTSTLHPLHPLDSEGESWRLRRPHVSVSHLSCQTVLIEEKVLLFWKGNKSNTEKRKRSVVCPLLKKNTLSSLSGQSSRWEQLESLFSTCTLSFGLLVIRMCGLNSSPRFKVFKK